MDAFESKERLNISLDAHLGDGSGSDRWDAETAARSREWGGFSAAMDTEHEYSERRSTRGRRELMLYQDVFMGGSELFPMLQELPDDGLEALDAALSAEGGSFADLAFFEEDHAGGSQVAESLDALRNARDAASRAGIAARIAEIVR